MVIKNEGVTTNECTERFKDIRDILKECDRIKYAAYRTSSKLRILQKYLLLDKVPLKVIDGVFERYQLQKVDNSMKMSPGELEPLLADIYFIVQKESATSIKKESVYQTVITLLLTIYDRDNKTEVSVLCCKIFLALLCQGKPREKYHYLFHQLSDYNNCLSKKKLQILLNNLVDIIEFIGEEKAFGKHLILGTVETCFKDFNSSIGITEDGFIYWLMQDPQLLVWVSILYRMQISELVSHGVKCGSCKLYPIVGLCYRCLRCMSYNMCQTCFFTGKHRKSHKLKHPIQEYCHPMSARESTKAFFLTIKNMLYRKNSTRQYLPALEVHPTDCKNSSENLGPNDEMWSPPPEFDIKELQSIIINLQEESEKLIPEIEALCRHLENSRVGVNPTEVRHCLLKHKIQIENEIGRLKMLRACGFKSKKGEIRSKAPMASTPVVRGFFSENNKRKKFNRGLENLSPIRVIDFTDSDSGESKKPERKLLWDNYDFGSGVVKDSWEELRGDANDICLITVMPETQREPTGCVSENVAEIRGSAERLRHLPVLDDSENESRRGFTWLREGEVSATDNSSGSWATENGEKTNHRENEFEELQTDLKQTLEKLRGLSADLNCRREETKDFRYEVPHLTDHVKTQNSFASYPNGYAPWNPMLHEECRIQ